MKKSNHLTPGEFELVEILWLLGEASVKDVQERMSPERGLAYTTVMTILEKMHKKGILSRRKQGKAHLYTATLDRDQALKSVIEYVCTAYFNGSKSELARFVASSASTTD